MMQTTEKRITSLPRMARIFLAISVFLIPYGDFLTDESWHDAWPFDLIFCIGIFFIFVVGTFFIRMVFRMNLTMGLFFACIFACGCMLGVFIGIATAISIFAMGHAVLGLGLLASSAGLTIGAVGMFYYDRMCNETNVTDRSLGNKITGFQSIVKENISPLKNKRSDLLTIICILFWVYAMMNLPILLLLSLFSSGFDAFVSVAYAFQAALIFMVTVASIGIFCMKKWGAVMYFLFLVIDMTTNIAIARGAHTYLKLMPLIIFCIQLQEGPSDTLLVGVNVIFYGILLIAGIGIIWMWFTKRLR